MTEEDLQMIETSKTSVQQMSSSSTSTSSTTVIKNGEGKKERRKEVNIREGRKKEGSLKLMKE